MVITKTKRNTSKSLNSSKKACYDSAQSHIYAAIQDLGKIADSDDDAKEAIANMSVVLFDLKSIS